MPTNIEFDEDKVKKAFERVLIKSVFKIQELAKRYAPADTGFLRRNIKIIKINNHKYIIVSEAPYSASMEFGSKPHWTSVENLKTWAKRKLGDENIAYALQKSMAKKGVKRQPFMIPAMMEVKNIWIDRFSNE